MNKLFKGSLLIAGTCIGGGILALPVLTSLGGFVPSLLLYFICWVFMACTGLLFLEILSWMPKESNIVSMSEKLLGKFGKYAAWTLYLFLFYCLTLAYIVGCGDLVSELFSGLPRWAGSILFLAIFGPFVYAGTHVVGRVNAYLMLGLVLSYFVFIFLGIKYVDTSRLVHRNWSLSMIALPICFTAFAFQGTIPTLLSYMHHDMKKTRTAILVGSFIPLLIYVIWEWLILGVIPTYGPGGLEEALHNGDNAIQPFKNLVQVPWVYTAGRLFSFFALITSFFGVTLGLMDFLADGLKVKKDNKGRFLLCLAIFLPPLLIAYTHPNLFLTALEYAGGFGCALLLGLMPILMVWSGRYISGLKSDYALPGGRLTLLVLSAFVLFELGIEIFLVMGKL